MDDILEFSKLLDLQYEDEVSFKLTVLFQGERIVLNAVRITHLDEWEPAQWNVNGEMVDYVSALYDGLTEAYGRLPIWDMSRAKIDQICAANMCRAWSFLEANDCRVSSGTQVELYTGTKCRGVERLVIRINEVRFRWVTVLGDSRLCFRGVKSLTHPGGNEMMFTLQRPEVIMLEAVRMNIMINDARKLERYCEDVANEVCIIHDLAPAINNYLIAIEGRRESPLPAEHFIHKI